MHFSWPGHSLFSQMLRLLDGNYVHIFSALKPTHYIHLDTLLFFSYFVKINTNVILLSMEPKS